ncbi:RNA-guided endonuclease InsQ/TnpB family protein [Lacrimispora celerecrescens]|uniref:Transposase n=1 Tax=Lacrimispora celerecrescens TaxID=29354 RepID=A0A084JRV4_9FIRM|nr:RNA-guided endonuclease TnpB family protein [Lacrimispora celerecrescens]KEZ91688.1 transposase [Lacrimispora celerecrescens]
MIKAVKVRLKPTNEQEAQLLKSAGVARFAYNWALGREKENRDNDGKFLNDQELRKEFTQLKQKEEYAWLYDTSNNLSKQAIKDACDAYKRFFKSQAGFPRFKSKRCTQPKFYNDNIKLKFKDGRFLIEKVGWVKISEPERIQVDKFHNPRVSFDGKYWYISVGIDMPIPTVELTDGIIGIDVGIKDLAVCSNKMKFENINKTKRTKKQAKKLRRLQRKASRKYEKNKNGKEYVKTSNIIKLEKQIRVTHRKIANTRLNHIHQAAAAIVKTKPSRVVMENLNVKGMMRNRHLSKAIGEQGFNLFMCILMYKCLFYGIEFVKADRFYPSSKTCCNCGYVKKDLKLNERVYQCPVCHNEIDRDYQASINLARYMDTA